jgi:hypothetical protein
MMKGLPNRTTMFRYIGSNDEMRALGVGLLVYEKDGKYFRVDNLEEVTIRPELYIREDSIGALRSIPGYLKLWWYRTWGII